LEDDPEYAPVTRGFSLDREQIYEHRLFSELPALNSRRTHVYLNWVRQREAEGDIVEAGIGTFRI
jgi:ribonuclease HI